MHIRLNHARTLVEYTLDLKGVIYLIVEEYNPILKTTNVVQIWRLLHIDMREGVEMGGPTWMQVRGAFAEQKQRQYGPPKKSDEAPSKPTAKKATKKTARKKAAKKLVTA